MKTKILIVATLALAALNICLIAVILTGKVPAPAERMENASGNEAGFSTAHKYVLYIGMNDKDSGTQLVTTEEARDRLNAVAARHADGFTVLRGNGYWKSGDNLDREETLIYVFYDIGQEQLAPILREMLIAMNQSAILVEKGDVLRTFHTARQ